MSRFGTTGTFAWDTGDTLANGTGIFLDIQDMPQFPFDSSKINDAVSYRSKSGRRYEYENFNKDTFTFSWVDLRETTRGSLFTMVHSLPILSFKSPVNTLWGTFRVIPNSWSDTETTHERFDVSFSIEEL